MSLFGFVAFVIWCYVILSFRSWVREDLGHKGRHTEARPLHEPVEIVVPGFLSVLGLVLAATNGSHALDRWTLDK